MKELKKTMLMHGRPGHPSFDGRSKALTNATATPKADIAGQPGNFAKCFVPDNVQPGDTFELRAGGRTVRVIVDQVEGDKPVAGGAAAVKASENSALDRVK